MGLSSCLFELDLGKTHFAIWQGKGTKMSDDAKVVITGMIGIVTVLIACIVGSIFKEHNQAQIEIEKIRAGIVEKGTK